MKGPQYCGLSFYGRVADIMILSLRNSREFGEVYNSSSSLSKADRLFVMYARANGMDNNRMGISVSKKVGNSVVRHRMKRLLKESYRLSEDRFSKGYDIVFIVRKGASGAGFHDVDKSVKHLGKKLGIYSE